PHVAASLPSLFDRPEFQTPLESGPSDGLGGVIPSWAASGSLGTAVIPRDVSMNLEIRNALAGMTRAQVFELAQRRSVIHANSFPQSLWYSLAQGLDVPMIKFDPAALAKPLKQVVLDTDSFKLAEADLDPGLDFAHYDGWLAAFKRFSLAVRILYPHRGLELETYGAEILEASLLYGWSAASDYDRQKRTFIQRFPMLRLTDVVTPVKERCLLSRRMLAPDAAVLKRPGHSDRAVGSSAKTVDRSQDHRSSKPGAKSGDNSRVCFGFNSSRGCRHNNCIFSHSCMECGKDHSIIAHKWGYGRRDTGRSWDGDKDDRRGAKGRGGGGGSKPDG
ncbi:hypothetical protein HDU67_005997, partial [Dinochytrium kinnereticum]